METKMKKDYGFTIVELLTVISIIALIIGLLVPALNKVNRIAKDTKQKAQFHAITTGLEMFKTENDEYPASNYDTTINRGICGAHKLAEALLGRDLQGYDTVSNTDNPEIYTNNPYGLTSVNTVDQAKLKISLDRRKGPYLSVDNASAYDVAQIYKVANVGSVYPGAYDENGGTTAGGNPAPVITDIYTATRISLSSGKSASVGTPILYYKANVDKKFNDVSKPDTESIYNIYDNDELVKLMMVKDNTKPHLIEADNGGTNTKKFYEMIANGVASPASLGTGISRPYKPDSFILLSAGFDGVFGTNDDITNFEE